MQSITGFVVTVTGTGEETQAALAVKGKGLFELMHSVHPSLIIVQGPVRGSDFDALLALHDATKLAVVRARAISVVNCRNYSSGFDDLALLSR